MGAKQSKRSVDISGKEAENAGEVAAAGAGGEGRMEPLADADALKPQLNGDAHINEASDKEKQLDAATPENEKDATTEKEGKEDDKDKEAVVAAEAPVTNGESEKAEVAENGDSSPAATPEDGKKPKKEKVKKKWSLRSISFSRKDKPKQEKKQKEEEPKTNGESDKVPEEAAEVIPEASAKEAAEEAKPDAEVKEEKSPVTPVTEPITNGSSSPDTPKEESPAQVEAPAPTPVAAPEEKPEPKAVPEPEQLPINGLSLEETKAPEPEVVISEESKPEEPTVATETLPAPEIPAKIEVCEQIPLIESTPPPLPANPPPSSVASFAATTMAPELTDASLPNTDFAMPHTSHPNNEPELPVEPPKVASTESVTQLPPRLKENSDEIIEVPQDEAEIVIKVSELNTPAVSESNLELKESDPVVVEESQTSPVIPQIELSPVAPEIEVSLVENVTEPPASVEVSAESNVEADMPAPPEDITVECNAESSAVDEQADTVEESTLTSESPADKSPEPQEESIAEDFPPPPPLDDDIPTQNDNTAATETTDDNTAKTNGIDKIVFNGNGSVEEENIKNKAKDPLDNVIEKAECNGNLEGAATPPPPASPTLSQEPVSVSDKMAELIPEIPAVPELSTEILHETSSDVAVAN